MALGPGPAQLVPAPFPQLCSWRWRPAGECALASTRTADMHVEGGQGGVRRDPPWAGSRGHRDTRPRVVPGHTRGPSRLRPFAQLSSPAAAHSPWHRHARPRTPWRPGILHCTGARCCCCSMLLLDAAAAQTVALQPARQSASSWAPSPSPRDRDGSLCYMSLGTLPNTPTHAHTPRPRTHRQGRAQTRAVTGTLAFTDTR